MSYPTGDHDDVVDPGADAARLADELLVPNAERVDVAPIVPSSHFRALADAGLFGIVGPADAGGAALAPSAARRVVASIAGGCGATFFVWVQHHFAVRAFATSRNGAMSDRLPDLCAGRRIAGTAFAHARRRGRPAITATPIGAGWRLDGTAPWATSWGIADMFSVAAVDPDDQLVFLLLDVDLDHTGPRANGGIDGLSAVPLPLPVLGATGTVVLELDGVTVAADRVIASEDLARWRRIDRVRASIGQTATLGIAGRVLAHLERRGSDDADLSGAVERLSAELAARWADDDELVVDVFDDGPRSADRTDETVAAASAHRARCLDLGRRATTAFLAATGGRGMGLDHPAQRLAREADFHVIQGQTADGRAAVLRAV